MDHKLFLAPMAGITDHAFRSICMSYGADCCVTELISAKAVVYGDKKTEALDYEALRGNSGVMFVELLAEYYIYQ